MSQHEQVQSVHIDPGIAYTYFSAQLCRNGVTHFQVFKAEVIAVAQPVGVSTREILVVAIGNPGVLVTRIIDGPSVFINIQKEVSDIARLAGTDVLLSSGRSLEEDGQVKV